MPFNLCEINTLLFHFARKGITIHAGQPSRTQVAILSHLGQTTTGIAPVDDTEQRTPVCELLWKMHEDLIMGSCVHSLVRVANLLCRFGVCDAVVDHCI